MTPEDILKSIYYDPARGHTGAHQLYLRAQKPAMDAGIKISEAKVRDWLKTQSQHQIFAPNGRDKPANWFKITDIPNSYAVDSIILDTYKNNNGGYRGFLLFVELTSRKAYAYPFKTGSEASPPTAEEALEIFEKFEAERLAEHHPVRRISGDQGKELTNRAVQDFLHSKFIDTYFHRAEDHRANGLLNVAVRYIRRMLNLHIRASADLKWTSNLNNAQQLERSLHYALQGYA